MWEDGLISMQCETGAAEDSASRYRIIFVLEWLMGPTGHFPDYARGVPESFVEAGILEPDCHVREHKT